VLALTRHRVAEPDGERFLAVANSALAALASRPGYVRGRIGRAADDPRLWVLTTEWSDVGSYRRALSAYEVKIEAVPLLSSALDEPTAFELLVRDEGGRHVAAASARAPGADRAGPGRR
jgi:hypothetical protein